jgi:hypothetical protein
MLQRCLALAGATIMLLACVARTSVTSFVDPAYRDTQTFSSVAVFALGVGLEERQIIEGTVAQRLADHGVRAVRGIDLVPPTRQVTEEEWSHEILASGADTLLLIAKVGQDVTHVYVPPTYHPGTISGTAQTFGNTTSMHLTQSPGYTTGGYTLSKPLATYTAVLLNVESGQAMWKADANSRGNVFADYNDLDRSLAEETAQKLIADHLF